MKKYISKFHYLTQDLPQRKHVEQVQIACSAGVNWVQYRCLTKPEDELITEINTIAEVCDDWGAMLIITNHYHLLNKVDVQGVHIEDFNADFAAIREYIGEDKILGGSATNLDDLLAIQQPGILDYCGFGPFAHTDTKPDNKPILGFSGYRELERYKIEVPIIAVGGIRLQDVDYLMQTGVYGIAVSAAINLSFDPAGAVKEFYRHL